MNTRNTEEWLKEFESFMKAEPSLPPSTVTHHVFNVVRTDLKPSLKLVSAKLFAFHAVATSAVVSVCPQLGVGPFVGGHGLGHVFMRFGALPCAALCGALLFLVSAALAVVFLKREELRAANRYRFLNTSLLVAVSFTALILLGADSDRLSYFFWIMGALFGGWAFLGLGATARLGSSFVVRA